MPNGPDAGNFSLGSGRRAEGILCAIFPPSADCAGVVGGKIAVQAAKIIGVMMRAWLHARAIGPCLWVGRDVVAAHTQDNVASGNAARKIIPK